MSETTEPEGTPAPEPEPTSTPAPESQPPETDEERKSRDGGDRRFAELTAKLSAAERREQQREQELEHWRRQAQQQPPAEETPEQRMARFEAEADARAEARLLQRRFHEEGNAAFPDWKQRCNDLIKMGADSHIAKLLVDTPGGVKIAAALAEDPAALERIADIQSPHGRAVALGKYAATIEDTAPARSNGAAPQVTRAPAPIRPVTGRVTPTFNEYTADANSLVDRYMKQAIERRAR